MGARFITHELTDERSVLLREGLIDAVMDQNPELEVRTAVGVIAAHFGRLEAPPRSTVTPPDPHDRELLTPASRATCVIPPAATTLARAAAARGGAETGQAPRFVGESADRRFPAGVTTSSVAP
jgi:hypothetical protein